MKKTIQPRRAVAVPEVAAGIRPGAGVLGLARQDSAAKPASDAEPGSEGTLIVGEGIHVRGEIEACDRLVVEGRVEASLEAAELTVCDGGVYQGKAVVHSATVAGRVEGDLTVKGLLVVEAGGRVSGTLRYRELTIAQGGRLSGDVDLLPEAADASGPDQDGADAGHLTDAAAAG